MSDKVLDESDLALSPFPFLNATCGECVYWRELDDSRDDVKSGALPDGVKGGFCMFNPPKAEAIVTINPLTQQPASTIKAIRPPLADVEPACGQFEPKDIVNPSEE